MKTGPHRTKAEREMNYHRIARMKIEGFSHGEIAVELGLSASQVDKDYDVIEQRWRDEYMKDVSTLAAREIAKYNALERTYWEAWKRSLEPREVTSTSQKQAGGHDSLSAMVRKEERDGNPAYLAGILACIQGRRQVWGLDKGDKVNIEDHIRKMASEYNLDADQAVREAQRILSAALASAK